MRIGSRVLRYFRPIAGIAAGAAAFGAGVYVARAGAGSTSGSVLSYSGVLQKGDTPLTGAQTLIFAFKKAGSEVCRSPDLHVFADAVGRFQTQIPLTDCPQSLFDGSTVNVDISVGGSVAAADVTVTSVPYALHADQLGTADCPSGYDRDAAIPAIPKALTCIHGNDQMVRVGTGATAFWIDRYEASVWSNAAGDAQQFGLNGVYPATFPANGQGTLQNQLYEVSKSGVLPSTQVTWFQASRACRASGKRLPTNDEWNEAASGTPRGSADQSSPCTASPGGAGGLRLTGASKGCMSVWGAEDMVGNTAEIMAEWAIGVGTQPGFTPQKYWPPSFGGKMFNVTSTSFEGSTAPMQVLRGATSGDNEDATVFSVAVTQTVAQTSQGFRCMIPR